MSLTWTELDPAIKLPSSVRDLHVIAGELVGIDVSGTVHRLQHDRWTQVVSRAPLAERVGMQLTLPAWDGLIHGIGSDGSVFVLTPGAEWSWSQVGAPDPKGPSAWPLGAFDAARGRLVAWGPQTAKGRKDDTWTFDRRSWTKMKKPKTPPADPIAGATARDAIGTGTFALAYDPRDGHVVRVGTREVSRFDGATWVGTPLAGGEVLGTWERATWLDPVSGAIVIAQRHKSNASLVRVDLASEPSARLVAKLPEVGARPSENTCFDHVAFDSSRRTLIAFDSNSDRRYEAELAPLLT